MRVLDALTCAALGSSQQPAAGCLARQGNNPRWALERSALPPQSTDVLVAVAHTRQGCQLSRCQLSAAPARPSDELEPHLCSLVQARHPRLYASLLKSCKCAGLKELQGVGPTGTAGGTAGRHTRIRGSASRVRVLQGAGWGGGAQVTPPTPSPAESNAATAAPGSRLQGTSGSASGPAGPARHCPAPHPTPTATPPHHPCGPASAVHPTPHHTTQHHHPTLLPTSVIFARELLPTPLTALRSLADCRQAGAEAEAEAGRQGGWAAGSPPHMVGRRAGCRACMHACMHAGRLAGGQAGSSILTVMTVGCASMMSATFLKAPALKGSPTGRGGAAGQGLAWTAGLAAQQARWRCSTAWGLGRQRGGTGVASRIRAARRQGQQPQRSSAPSHAGRHCVGRYRRARYCGRRRGAPPLQRSTSWRKAAAMAVFLPLLSPVATPFLSSPSLQGPRRMGGAQVQGCVGCGEWVWQQHVPALPPCTAAQHGGGSKQQQRAPPSNAAAAGGAAAAYPLPRPQPLPRGAAGLLRRQLPGRRRARTRTYPQAS